MGIKRTVNGNYAHIQDFVSSLEKNFEYGGKMLHNGRNKVKEFEVNGKSVIVKKFKRPNLAQKITSTFFKKSKAERAYLYAGKLRELGFLTPHEIAFIEIKRNTLLDESYFVCEQCPYPSLLGHILNDNGFNGSAIDALAEFLATLHSKGVLHGDLNLTNILYRVEGGNYEFTLIDTNRSIFKDNPTKKECIENMKRISHNKDLLERIATGYAKVRGWDSAETAGELLESLSRFEKKIGRKRKFQKMTGLRK